MAARKKRPLFETVAVLGLGLIGGSIALATKQSGVARQVIGANRGAENLRTALRRGVIDWGTRNFIEAASMADLIVLATSIRSIPEILQMIAPVLRKNVIVTDVASTKVQVVAEAEDTLRRRGHFVGGHPMAGSHRLGVENASVEMLRGAKYFIAPTRKTSRAAIAKVKKWITMIGMFPVVASPAAHDAMMAGVSHLPIALAAALINTSTSLQGGAKTVRSVAGPAFRDMTRVAGGDPVLAEDIFATNREEVLKMIRRFEKELNNIAKAISAKKPTRLRKLLEKARAARLSLTAS